MYKIRYYIDPLIHFPKYTLILVSYSCLNGEVGMGSRGPWKNILEEGDNDLVKIVVKDACSAP